MLYRQQYGVNPLKVEADRPFDVAAATTEDGKTLTLAIVNPTVDRATFDLNFNGLKLADSAERFEIADPDQRAYNDPDKSRRVDIVKTTVEGIANGVTVAPQSVTLYRVAIDQTGQE